MRIAFMVAGPAGLGRAALSDFGVISDPFFAYKRR
jgi:hypothetical protein